MARTKMGTLNEQIRKAEEDVIRIGDRYNAACDKLKELRAKKAAIEHDELIAAFIKSGKSYEEVMTFLGTSADETSAEDAGRSRRKGRPKRNGGAEV